MTTATTAIGQRVALGRVAPGGAARQRVNVGETERMLSALGGGAMLLAGLARGSLGGLALAALGGSLVYRGLTGHCSCYQMLGLSTSGPVSGPVASVPAGEGVKIVEAITIN